MLKGISGGERKCTSIGYEMIAEPPLLILDEPTSGLDSNTSMKIMNLMKREAVDGDKSIICTIHQPQADIFNIFDRVILLSEGYMLYNGPPSQVPEYFS